MTVEVEVDSAPEPKAVLKVSDFEAPEPETVEVPDEEAEESEPEEEDGETGENGTGEPEEESEAEATPPKGKSVQKRFDELTAARREAEREAEFWRAKALASTKENEPERTETAPAETKLEEPNAADFEFGDADPAYLKAMMNWTVETRLGQERQVAEKKQQAAQAQETARQIEATYAENVAKAKEDLPDYDEVVTESVKRGEWPCPQPVAELIKSLPAGPKVAYHLATNLDDAVELAGMPPAMQLVAFGALAAKFSESSTEQQPKKSTSAPPPPQNRTRGSGGQYETGERSLYKKMLREFR